MSGRHAASPLRRVAPPEALEVLFDQAMNADSLQLGRENQNLVRLEGMILVDDVEDGSERLFELRIAGTARNGHPWTLASASGCMVSGSYS